MAGESVTKTAIVNGRAFDIRFLPAADAATDDDAPASHVVIVATDISRGHPAVTDANEREAHLIGVLDAISDGVVTFDALGLIREVNRAAERIFGYPAEEILGRGVDAILPGLEVGKLVLPLNQETEGRGKDGAAVAIELSIRALRSGENQTYAATIIDITRRREAERALRESNERYALAASGANDGLWDWDLAGGTVYYSSRWLEMLGLDVDEVKDSPDEWLSRIHPEDVIAFCENFDGHLDGKTAQFEHEYRMRHGDGEFRWMQARGVAVRRADGTAYRMAGSQSDITSRKRAEESLMHGALHDSLTGLSNRVLMLDRVGQALARLKRDGRPDFALAMLDLDRFMVVNESLGHGAGDELLVSLARRLEKEIRPGDTLARLGGDEFAVLIEGYDSFDEVGVFVKRLRHIVAQPFIMDDKEVFTSASFGIAIGADSYARADDVLRDADLAMHHAKKEGKSGFEIFDASRHRHSVDQLQVESGLRRALKRGEIVVYYQPIIDLAKGGIVGFEALARMIHPAHGVIPPGEFISIAEETGLIVPLGEQVLEMACQRTMDWQREFDRPGRLSIAVNLSARHLAEDNIVELIAGVLARTGLPPGNLKIEITESLIMTNPELAAQTLARIKNLGVKLSLDDFGTGYSSLSYLRRFPIDTLKMDRSFVSRIDADAHDLELVRMIILLAHTLGMDVVGEGVENESHCRLLRDLNCEYGQGYLFAKPLPGKAATELLHTAPVWL